MKGEQPITSVVTAHFLRDVGIPREDTDTPGHNTYASLLRVLQASRVACLTLDWSLHFSFANSNASRTSFAPSPMNI